MIKESSVASVFNGVAVDRSGNVYAVGYIAGSGTFDFGGESVSFSGKGSSFNAVIVKYNASGNALWASLVETAPAQSMLNGVSVDVLGNLYAVGYIVNTGSFYFGGNSSPVNSKSKVQNTVIVKYNQLGVAKWAKTVNAVEGTGTACDCTGIAVDGSGYSYAVRTMTGLGEFNFGGKSNPSPNRNIKTNTIIVKYY